MLELGDAGLAFVAPDAEPRDQPIRIFDRQLGDVFVAGAPPGVADAGVRYASLIEHGDDLGVAHRPLHVFLAELERQGGQTHFRLGAVELLERHADLRGPAGRHQLGIALLVEAAA